VAYNSAKSALQEYLQVIKLQLFIVIACGLITFVVTHNLNTTISALLGGALVLLPAMLYVKFAYSRKVISAERVLARHKKAELIKFLANVGGFVVVFSCFRQVQALVLFAAYVVTLSSYWLILGYSRLKR
jgi:ATP synthase protein I